MSVLCCGLTANVKTGKARNIGTGRRCRSLPGLEKHRAETCSFLFGKTASTGKSKGAIGEVSKQDYSGSYGYVME